MLIGLSTLENDLAVTARDVVCLFYPESDIVSGTTVNGADINLIVSAHREGSKLTGSVILKAGGIGLSEAAEMHSDRMPVPGDERNQQKRLVKLAIFRLLCRYTGTPPGPWGILTGIRPTKIVHRLLDLAWSEPQIKDYLMECYDMAADKAALLITIAMRQRPFLLTAEQASRLISIYVGIPFCPTRCAYCSFPAFSLGAQGKLMNPFLEALCREITGVGRAAAELGLQVQTIYIGGGTPTVFDSDILAVLLACVDKNLAGSETGETTLEAGRPDTITKPKLAAAREHGITRLSINPQTMNSSTLAAIGRNHTPEQVAEAVEMARGQGFDNINMDIIIGLPGETPRDVENTLQKIAAMEPENLTVHTLAVKRASKIRESKEEFSLPTRELSGQMLEMTAQGAGEMGMRPYYLYRQKKMVGPLENIGYARPGYDCLYNIQMIEERQTIIGLGGGAGSKFVEPGTWFLTSYYNPKDPENYISRIDELIARKIQMLKEIF